MMGYKHRYPFRLATTSFIFPADYASNVKRIGPLLDEVELLLFESNAGSLPSPAEIKELAALAEALDITYNVHLPLDLDLCSEQPAAQDEAVRCLERIIELTAVLNPITHTLHLPCPLDDHDADAVLAWQKRAGHGLTRLLALDRIAPQRLSIETLDYPPQWFAGLVSQLDLSVCVDVGHMLRYNLDPAAVLQLFRKRISILHLHGVEEGKDHRSLTWIDPPTRQILVPFLKQFEGSVSLEVFSWKRLIDSLVDLQDMMA